MDLAKPHVFLVVARPKSNQKHQVRIVTSLAQVIASWTYSTRVSPIWGVEEFGTATAGDESFPDRHSLLLVGPVHPERVLVACSRTTRIWLTLGLFNMIIQPTDDAEKKRVLAWCKDNGVPFEAWEICDSTITKTKTAEPANNVEWRTEIEEVASLTLKAEVAEAAREYSAAMATALARSQFAGSQLYADLFKINAHVKKKLVQAAKGTDEETSPYRTFGHLLDINMGLGRLVSQTFSGTSLISDTECHFRYHSLLGIGVASLGLWELRSYIQSKLGEARIPERFRELKKLPTVGDLSSLQINNPFWSEDHLSKVELDQRELEPIVPLLSYFSARDGFRSTSTTISVPLAAVSACNSKQWSLTTITHEVSHIIIHNILASIYPSLSDPSEVTKSRMLIDKKRLPENLLEEIQRYVLLTVVAMHTVGLNFKLSDESFVEILQRTFNEVEEVLVHVFDFIYFYGMSPSKYVRGIWASWGTIPNINARVHEYVVRTICAVLAGNLRRSVPSENRYAEDISKEQVLSGLRDLKAEGDSGTYIDAAIEYIEQSWDSEIREAVQTRRHLVKVVHTFLFSEEAAHALRQEVWIRGKTGEKEGYALKKGRVEQTFIMNPLRFIEFYTDAKHSSASDSAWIYNILAFCIENDESRAT